MMLHGLGGSFFNSFHKNVWGILLNYMTLLLLPNVYLVNEAFSWDYGGVLFQIVYI